MSRRLSDEERVLWKGVTGSIAPLRKPHPKETDDAGRAEPVLHPRPRVKALPAVPLLPPKPVMPPPLAPLTRKARQRIARGRHEIDGRLDLHGMTQAEAHDALFSFIRARQARGQRLILVITGKGALGGGDGRGVLRRMVPLWLALPEFRSLVIGFEPAAVGHGGEGALYVNLRRPR
jgi:DNA-nicking Smr family endonuclease